MSLPTLTFTAPNSTPIPTGEYAVKCIGIEVIDNQFEAGKQQLKWQFEVVAAGEHQGRKLTGFSSTSTVLTSKAARWVGALLGRPLGDGESIDLNALIGKHCIAVVVCRAKSDGTEFSKLEDLKPLKPAAQATPSVPAQPVYPQATPAPVQAQAQPQATPAQPVQATDPFAQ